jgi:hypothetical protein
MSKGRKGKLPKDSRTRTPLLSAALPTFRISESFSPPLEPPELACEAAEAWTSAKSTQYACPRYSDQRAGGNWQTFSPGNEQQDKDQKLYERAASQIHRDTNTHHNPLQHRGGAHAHAETRQQNHNESQREYEATQLNLT